MRLASRCLSSIVLPIRSVAHGGEGVLVLDVSGSFLAAAGAGAAFGQRQGGVKGEAVAVSFVGANFDAVGDIQGEGNAGTGHGALPVQSWQETGTGFA